MLARIKDPIGPTYNVRITTYDLEGNLLEKRENHNILTNIGRNWLRDLVGGLDYTATDVSSGFLEGAGNVRTSERVRYMAFGVGGILTSDSAVFSGTQEELVTVTELEDYVKIDSTNYMKEVLPQTDGSDAIPTNFSIRFITTILESEVSFTPNVTSSSAVDVGTLVKVSEAGLYLSGADPTLDLSDPENNTRLVAYDVFDPVSITPNVVTRVEWEFRF